jgi:hypothetical protein
MAGCFVLKPYLFAANAGGLRAARAATTAVQARIVRPPMLASRVVFAQV